MTLIPDATASRHVYETSHIKRQRATKDDMADRRKALLAIVEEQRPMTVRQAFYQATVRGIIDKTEAGYGKVQRALADMRRDGVLPYSWLADNTRWMRKPDTYRGIEHALRSTAKFYRRALWADADAYCEVWLEKDALAGVVQEVTEEYDVPLMVSRGYASLSFLHSAAETISEQDRPCYIYHVGDHDPSGVNAAEKIEQTLRELAPGAELYFQRLAVLPWQIIEWNLPSRPTKTTDTRAKNWRGGESVELDAIPPDWLRDMIRHAIEQHMPREQVERIQAVEEQEKQTLFSVLSYVGRGRA